MTVSLAEATAAARRMQGEYPVRAIQHVPQAFIDDAVELAAFVLAGQDCDGSSDCAAAAHVHGCFADDGKCDEPNEHGLAGDTARLREALAAVGCRGAAPGGGYCAGPNATGDEADWPKCIVCAALAGGSP